MTEASAQLGAFLEHLTPGARILELGCGGGRDAAAMIARGFDVDVTDGSAALASLAAARLGRPVRVMRFEQLAADAAYDAVWANACLLHVPRSGLTDVLARVGRALRPGGLHAASYKIGEAEGRDRLGRYYNRLRADELVGCYQATGEWEWVDTQLFASSGYDGAPSAWARLTMRRGPSRE